MDLSTSPKAQELLKKAKQFVEEKLIPLEADTVLKEDLATLNPNWKEWTLDPRLEALKQEAKDQGLWNLFFPDLGLLYFY